MWYDCTMNTQEKLLATVIITIIWCCLMVFINTVDNTIILRVLASAGLGHVLGTVLGYIAGLKSN